MVNALCNSSNSSRSRSSWFRGLLTKGLSGGVAAVTLWMPGVAGCFVCRSVLCGFVCVVTGLNGSGS